MKTKCFTLLAVIFLTAATLAPAATNDLSGALQKGLFEEEANHNLDAAITAYQSVATQFDRDRKLAATAIFRLGEVYRKQGKTNEATAQYERILKEFSDQTTLTDLSRNLLPNTEKNADKVGILTVSTGQSEEDKEIQRIKAMIKDSPDLINALREGVAPLHTAACNGQLKIAEFLLANGANVNRRHDQNKTPLYLAAESGHRAMVELLIAKGANVNGNDFGQTALHIASEQGFKAVAQVLLENKADVNAKNGEGNTPLHFAARAGNRAVAELLLANGADVNGKNSSGSTPLMSAVAAKNLEMAKVLIERKADVNALRTDGYAALHLAIQDGQPQLVQLLLQSGANPEIKVPKYSVSFFGPQTYESVTPLHMAAQARQKEIVEMLLVSTANPNSTTRDGSTPLHYAASRGFVEIAMALIQKGAFVNTKTDSGATPLMRSLQYSHKNMAEFLLSNEADPNLPTESGGTLLALVKRIDEPARSAFTELLLKYGANENAERLTRISVGRDAKSSEPIYPKGNRPYNRYGLFEVIGQGRIPFPDLTRVKIHRLNANTQQTNVITVDVDEALQANDCSKNVWLEWGDIIEIPELDHPLNQRWPGYAKDYAEALRKCLDRTVSVMIKGQTTNLVLRAGTSNQDGITRVFANQSLYNVISPFLRASSDKTRIKISRVDPVTKKPVEIIQSLETPAIANSVSLLDGDVIEVPEK